MRIEGIGAETAVNPAITARKALAGAIKVGLSVGVAQATGALSAAGVTIPPEVVGAVFGGVLHAVANVLKRKLPRLFGWL